jgi:hypothetical protein
VRHVHCFFAALLAALFTLGSSAAPVEDRAAGDGAPVAPAFSFGFETLRLAEGERLGLVGATLLFDIDDGVWSAGPAVYGAASGQRGGFFVGGVQVERVWNLSRGLSATAGLYAGGGGGAAAPVGGGLMLRPSLTLQSDLGRAARLGLSWSSVRFPSGQISSRQLGLRLSWSGTFRQMAVDRDAVGGRRAEPTGLGFDRISATVSRYVLRDGRSRRIGLVGARAEQGSGRDGLSWGLDAAAAAQGDAAGYMEMLGSLAYGVQPVPAALPSWRVGLRAAVGLGGGGGVPTGGGLIGRAAATTSLSPWPGTTFGVDLGLLRGDSRLRASVVEARLGFDLESVAAGSGAPATTAATRLDWVASVQHHTREPRSDGSQRALDTIGLAINHYLGEHIYISGQAHSAFAGGAGALSVGLLGAGVAAARPPLRVGAELLVGAAGGGGVATGGGATTQGLIWAAWKASPQSDWRVGVGQRRSLRGATGSPVIELSWSHAFRVAR